MFSVQNLILGTRTNYIFLLSIKMVAIAQLVRASDCGSEGRGFEPHWLPKINKTLVYSGFYLFMYYTYILKSNKDGKYYYGHTADLNSRLKEHNNGKVRATKGRRPLIIHYYEILETKSEAAKRELFFKSINGYIFLKQEKII